jgi:hypothetical protein
MQIRTILLGLISALLLFCQIEGKSQTKENITISGKKKVTNIEQTTETSNQEILTNKGFDLMETESVGAIKFGLTTKQIIELIGKPDKIEKPFYSEVDGETYQHYYYKSKGIFLSFVIKSDSIKEVRLIEINAPSSLKTSKNIGIGSGESEVMSAYKEYINKEFSDSSEIVAGSPYGGIVFSIQNQKVKSIYIGPIAD